MNKHLGTVWNSFRYAFCGLWFCIRHERNFRIHTIALMYVLLFSGYYDFTKAEFAVLLLCIGAVLSFEMMNTALEQAVNLSTPTQNPIAKIAKDVSAGAVLMSAIVSVVIGIILFWDIEILSMIIHDIGTSLPKMIVLLLSILLSYGFIFKWNKK